jgi:hypothetical protein
LPYFEHPAGSTNRNKILNALMKIGNSYPRDIKKFLDDDAKKHVENQASSASLSADKKERLVKKREQSPNVRFLNGWDD